MRVAVLLVLLVLATHAEAGARPDVDFDLLPELAPLGAPFAVALVARGEVGATVEAKVWIGSATSALSRTFDGVRWVHGSRYAARATVGEDGTARFVVPLLTDAPAGNATVHARVRSDGATSPIVEAPIAVVARGDLVPRWSEEALAVATEGGRVVALGTAAPDPEGGTTPQARVLAPAGAEVAREIRPPAVRFVGLSNHEAELDATSATFVCLRAGLARTCADLPAGRSVVALPGRGEVVLAVWGEVVDRRSPPRTGAERLEAGVWKVRPIGFEAFDRLHEDAEVASLVLPDDGPSGLEYVARAAAQTLDAAVYTLTSEDVAAELAGAAFRGVRVRLLVEGAPVGGMPPEETRLLAALDAAGVEVRALRTNGTFAARYPSMHAKFLVADRDIVLVSTENWGAHTNRGWGLVVRGPGTAAHLAEVFEHDFRGRDAVAVDASGGRVLRAVSEVAPVPTFHRGEVETILAPDHALSALRSTLRAANRTIDLQLLFLEPDWSDGVNPLLREVLEAARRGVRVRIHLDGTVRDNAASAERILDLARDLPVEVRVEDRDRTIHTKGILVDRERVVVGSVNWGEASVLRNREVALAVRSEEVAARFARTFDGDWEEDRADLRPTPWPWTLAAAALALGRKRGGRPPLDRGEVERGRKWESLPRAPKRGAQDTADRLGAEPRTLAT